MDPRLAKTLKIIAVTLFLLWTVIPIIFLVASSFKATGDIFDLPPVGDWVGMLKLLFFFKASFTQFRNMFIEGPFFTYLGNSLLATGLSVLISVPLGLLAAYALSRGRIPGKKHFYFWVISTRMAPPVAVMVPLYVLWRSFHILQTLPGLVLAYTTFNLPFSIWLLRGFMDSIPKELEEAAYVDGRGRFRAFTDIVFPLIAPGVGATVILCSLMAWNDYLFALILGGRAAKTIPVGISELESATSILWGQIMAGGTVLIIPMIILGLVIKKFLVTGLTMGAMRG
ncbi:MAG: carbohydrate ABC transporter permease [Desulfobacterales bacterium]|nr:MAG: carbohydrate ABC transporter permease [Desulfobacterales bacterium]